MRINAILIICFSFLLACNNDNKKDEQIDELNRKIDSLTDQQKESDQLKEKEAAEAKAKDTQEKKDLIIEQIKMGEGLVLTVKHDPVGLGGINNGTIGVENALSGIVFQVITIETTVYLDNGKVYDYNTYTFTNLKPGDVRTRSIPNTDDRGIKCTAMVTEIQSNWLTNGKLVAL
ncbi:MAG: hypothetical protein ACT4OJ_14345 [Bacteroidota bacterium]